MHRNEDAKSERAEYRLELHTRAELTSPLLDAEDRDTDRDDVIIDISDRKQARSSRPRSINCFFRSAQAPQGTDFKSLFYKDPVMENIISFLIAQERYELLDLFKGSDKILQKFYLEGAGQSWLSHDRKEVINTLQPLFEMKDYEYKRVAAQYSSVELDRCADYYFFPVYIFNMILFGGGAASAVYLNITPLVVVFGAIAALAFAKLLYRLAVNEINLCIAHSSLSSATAERQMHSSNLARTNHFFGVTQELLAIPHVTIELLDDSETDEEDQNSINQPRI